MPIYGDGLNIRDWLYVDDHCRGIDLVLDKGKVGEVYNIGGNNEWANIDIVKLVCRLMDQCFSNDKDLGNRFPEAPQCADKEAQSLITYVADRLGHDRRYAIDAPQCRADLGYEPVESFETGIQKTIDWMLDNEFWWQGVMDGSYRKWIDQHYSK